MVDSRWPYDAAAAAAAAAASDPATVRRLQKLAYWLDDRFTLPGINRRIGLDGLLGLVPGIGDLATGVLSAYILAEAWRLGVPTSQLARMGTNWAIDVTLGSVPIVGDMFDIAWKANRKNVSILLRHLESRSGGGAAASHGDTVGDSPRQGAV